MQEEIAALAASFQLIAVMRCQDKLQFYPWFAALACRCSGIALRAAFVAVDQALVLLEAFQLQRWSASGRRSARRRPPSSTASIRASQTCGGN
jgi:hypothetical protein